MISNHKKQYREERQKVIRGGLTLTLSHDDPIYIFRAGDQPLVIGATPPTPTRPSQYGKFRVFLNAPQSYRIVRECILKDSVRSQDGELYDAIMNREVITGEMLIRLEKLTRKELNDTSA